MRVGLANYTIQNGSLPRKQDGTCAPVFKAISPSVFGRIHDLHDHKTTPQKVEPAETNIESSGLSAKELFKYGIDAIDENTLFIATNNRENTNLVLRRFKENII